MKSAEARSLGPRLAGVVPSSSSAFLTVYRFYSTVFRQAGERPGNRPLSCPLFAVSGGGDRLGLPAPDDALKNGAELLVGGDGVRLGQLHGVPAEMYVTARESIAEIDENGSVNQDEAARAIGSMPGLTDEERAMLWQMQNKGWKPDKNPFSVRAGREVYEAFQKQKGETEEKELRGLD